MTDITISEPSAGSNPKLIQQLYQRLESSPQHLISFAEFMQIALYEPKLGYYASNHRQLGPQGDFVTSAHLTPDYGELLAGQIFELWTVLDRPAPFSVVEMGPGQGLISADALTYLLQIPEGPDCLRALSWSLVETSEALIRWQQHYLKQRLEPKFIQANLPFPVHWTSLDSLRDNPVCGCFFSNELVDALPCHLLQMTDGVFYEVGVSADAEGTFVETLIPLSSELADYLDDMIPPEQSYPPGYRCEVNLAAKHWIADVATCLDQGYVLTIDYGYPAAQLYSPSRQGGTLQCYAQHRSHDDPYINIGNQDITSHVNFTALKHYGAQHQLEVLGQTQQGLFLMALGLGDRLMDNNTNSDMTQLNATLQRRDALHSLINPLGLGRFQVLLQGKGLTAAQKSHPYRGFAGLDPLF